MTAARRGETEAAPGTLYWVGTCKHDHGDEGMKQED